MFLSPETTLPARCLVDCHANKEIVMLLSPETIFLASRLIDCEANQAILMPEMSILWNMEAQAR